MTRKKPFDQRKYIEESHPGEEVGIFDDLGDAFMGVGQCFDHFVAVYDREAIIQILMKRDGMDRETAEEHFSFNIQGGFYGVGKTPVILDRIEDNTDSPYLSRPGLMPKFIRRNQG